MLLFRLLALALLLAALSPTAASAGVRLASRDEPIAGGRALASGARVLPARAAPFRFHLVGLHWRGSGPVWFRTALARGAWSAWRPARPEGEDLPDRGSAEAGARRGWVLGNPWWTGRAGWIQYRVGSGVSRLRAHFVATAPRTVRALAIPGTPRVISRAAWGADESIVRARPSYAASLRFAVVHHTAGSSPSSPAESAAIIRAIQAYHVRSNGWNDIGYNFLVDRFGQIFEGRGGGVTRNVIGAHAQGFNTGSVGVAVLGSYGATAASADAEAAVASLLAWRLDLAHVDPLARLTWISAGNPRFPAGAPVTLAAVSGHRDTGYTSCPGDALYRRLSQLATRAAGLGLPKLFDAVVTGALGAPVRFTARLSEALPWSVTVTDAAGTPVASGSGTGAQIDWTWDSTGAPRVTYLYRIDAGPTVRPATGSFGAVPLAVTSASVAPAAFTPNGDGVDDRARITFSLAAAASVTLSLVDAAGTEVATIVSERAARAGKTTIRWNGTSSVGVPVPDGRYRLVVTARAGGSEAARSARVVVDRTLGAFRVAPYAFSPNGDGRRDRLALGFDLTAPATALVRIVAGTRTVAKVLHGALAGGGRQTLSWNGRRGARRVADGRYLAVVETTSFLGRRKLARRFVLDTRPPTVSALSATRVRGTTRIALRLSERARLTVSLDGRPFEAVRRAGYVVLARPTPARRVRVVATDAAGNGSAPATARVRR